MKAEKRRVPGPWHPTVPLAYAVCVLALTMTAFEPVCSALALGGGLLYGARRCGLAEVARPLVWQLPLLVIICLLNPFFTGLGSTLLLTLGGRPVYLESLVFGVNMGCMLLAVLVWASALGEDVGADAALDALARPLPVAALMVSMSMRMVPLFVRRGREMSDLQTANSAARGSGGAASAVVQRSALMTALVGWGLEDSFELSDSMISRGWRAGARRSHYRRGRFRWRDGVALGVVLGLVAWDAWTLAGVCGAWHWYPTLAELAPWQAYLSHVLVMLLPTVALTVEDLRWSLRETREVVA